MECYGTNDDECCSAVANNACTSHCTDPERPLPSANYTCSKIIRSLISGLIEDKCSISDEFFICDRQKTNKQTDRRTDRNTGRQTDGQTHCGF